MLETSHEPTSRPDMAQPTLPEEIFRDSAEGSGSTPEDAQSNDSAPSETMMVADIAGEPTRLDTSADESAAIEGQDDHIDAAETVDKITLPKKNTPKALIALGLVAATGVTAVIAGVAGVFGGNRTAAAPQPLPSASAPVTPGPTAAESTPIESTAPTETSEPSPSVQPSESASTEPSASETATTSELPSVEEFRQMTPEQRLEAIRIPESMLSNPEAVYRRHFELKQYIYNAAASDQEYLDYRKNGGVDYVTYIMDKYYKPLLKQLEGKEPSDNVDDQGALVIAYRLANVQSARLNDNLPGFAPYHFEYTVHSVEPTTPASSAYTIKGMISSTDSIDATQVERLKNLENFETNVIDTTPIEITMFGVHYNKETKTIQPNKLSAS